MLTQSCVPLYCLKKKRTIYNWARLFWANFFFAVLVSNAGPVNAITWPGCQVIANLKLIFVAFKDLFTWRGGGGGGTQVTGLLGIRVNYDQVIERLVRYSSVLDYSTHTGHKAVK